MSSKIRTRVGGNRFAVSRDDEELAGGVSGQSDHRARNEERQMAMRPEEKHAMTYLQGLNLGPVVYEPIPNEPPDFLIDGRIAVEVRRLNENVGNTARGEMKGIEQARVPIENGMTKLLRSYGGPIGNSAIIGYKYKRPIRWKAVEQKIRAQLDGFLANPWKGIQHVTISESFTLTINGLSFPSSQQFSAQVISDEDSGGDLVELTKKNLDLVALEKEIKVARNRNKYPLWWLVLVDAIGIALEPFEIEELRAMFKPKHSFEKLIILSATGPLEV